MSVYDELPDTMKAIRHAGLLRQEQLARMQVLSLRASRIAAEQGTRLGDMVNEGELADALELAKVFLRYCDGLNTRTERFLANMDALIEGLEVELQQTESDE